MQDGNSSENTSVDKICTGYSWSTLDGLWMDFRDDFKWLTICGEDLVGLQLVTYSWTLGGRLCMGDFGWSTLHGGLWEVDFVRQTLHGRLYMDQLIKNEVKFSFSNNNLTFIIVTSPSLQPQFALDHT